MSFEEWMRKEYGKYYADNFSQEQLNLMSYTWNEAKEDSKPIAHIQWNDDWFGGVDFSSWVITNCHHAISFPSKDAAEQYAVKSGYRLK